MPRKVLIPLIALIAVGALGIIGFTYYFSPPPTELTIYGNVDIRDVDLGFRVPGRLEKVLFDEGHDVKAGDLLAALDKQPYMDTLAQRKADVGVKKAILENAHVTFQRDQTLFPGGGISKQVSDTDKYSEDQAKASLDMAIAAQQAAETDLKDTELFAPSDGVIMTRALEPGAILASSNTVLTVNLNKEVWVRAYIDEASLGQVAPGKHVEVFTDTDSKHVYHGTVGFVSPEAEFTPKTVESTELRTSLVYRLRIRVDDSDGKLRQGMPCTVKIQL